MDEQEAQALTRAYTTLRDELHHLALQEQPGHVALDCFAAERAQVTASWQEMAGGAVRNKSSVILSRANCESFWSQE